jgi:hypothetical protein
VDINFSFSEKMKVEGANPTIMVQPKYIYEITGPNAEKLYTLTTYSAPYSEKDFANGATISIGPWGASWSDTIEKLPKSGTIYVNLSVQSVISLDRCSIPSGTAVAVGEFTE